MKLPLDRAVGATRATLLEAQRAPALLQLSTDTRSLQRGDTFLALRGERFDGHAFTAEAVRCGAAALVVDDVSAAVAGVATLVVKNAQSAYLELAGLARRLFGGMVVGITGSTGKTTTRTLLEQLARVGYGDRVLAAPGNENNEIGVSKLLLEANAERHDLVIVEMGARSYGDVATLADIARPQIGVLTNVGEAHLEIMGSRARLADTKWAIFSRGARAVLNAADAVSRERAGTLGEPAHWFAAVDDEVHGLPDDLERLTAIVGEGRIVDRSPGGTTACDALVRLPGRHNRCNLAAAIAAALELDIPLRRLAPAIETLELPAGRYAQLVLSRGPKLIYDAYNANASGMIAALDAFGGEHAARRIAVLASMAELGEESQALHERVGAHAARNVDVLLVSGDFAAELARGAREGGLDPSQIVLVDGNADAAAWLRDHATADDVVLLKGSRKYRLEEIVEALQA